MKYYHYLFFCLLLFFNCKSKQNNDVVNNNFIVLTISADEKIYYKKEEIQYCEINDELNKILDSDTVSNSCIELHPNLNVNMHFIKCLMDRKLKHLGVDSIKLWKKTEYITFKIKKDKIVKPIFIHIINNEEILLEEKRIPIIKLHKEIDTFLRQDDKVKIYLSFKKGVSYNTYLKCKKIVERIIDKYVEFDKSKVSLIEDNCPYCPPLVQVFAKNKNTTWFKSF